VDPCVGLAMNLETKPSQITGIIGGQIVSLSDTPLLTSASTPWSGFLLEEVRGDLVRNEVSWGWHRTHVCLVTRGCIRFTLKVGGRQEHVIVRQGAFLTGLANHGSYTTAQIFKRFALKLTLSESIF